MSDGVCRPKLSQNFQICRLWWNCGMNSVPILQCSLNNPAKIKETLILSAVKGVAGETIHICSGYLIKITFSIQFSSCTSLYIYLHLSIWNCEVFEGLEPSSRLVYEKYLCSDIFCRHETKTRGGGMLILNFSWKFSDVRVHTKLCIFRQLTKCSHTLTHSRPHSTLHWAQTHFAAQGNVNDGL